MAWLKLTDDFAEHPKVEDLSDRAFRVHVGEMLRCARYLTDGFVKAPRGEKAGADVVAELVHARLWIPVDGGWLINDWLDHNPPAEKVKEQRRKDAERKAAARAKADRNAEGRYESARESTPDADADGGADSEPTAAVPVPSRPVPDSSSSIGCNAYEDDDLEALLNAAAECHANHQARTTTVKNDSAWRPTVKANYRRDKAELLAYYAKTRRTGESLWRAVATHGQQKVLEKPLPPDNGGNPNLEGTAADRAAARAALKPTA